MKFRRTLLLFAVFVVLLGIVAFFDSRGEKKRTAEENESTLISINSADVRKASLVRDGETLTFERDETGPWPLNSRLQAAAGVIEVD